MFFENFFQFIKKYPAILYSIFLIIFIPFLLYYTAFFSGDIFQKNIDSNLQTKALLAENIFNVFAKDFIEKPEILEEKIKEIIQQNPEIKNLRIFREENGEFRIIISQNPNEKGKTLNDPSLSLSWSQNQSIANLVFTGGERFWKVTSPIVDRKGGKKLGVISFDLSLKESDTTFKRSLYIFYTVILLSIVLTIFLILQHARLFSFVALSKKLQEIDKAKDEFIRMATHELLAPVVNIKNYIGVLREEIQPSVGEDQKKFLSVIEISVQNLHNLIQDILEVSRIEQGRLDFTKSKINPEEILEKCYQELEPKAKEKGLNLIFKKSERDFYIMANPNRLHQIFFNLIENAIKYTFHGEISLETKIDSINKKCYINISDTGIGISAENQKRLFEKFFRVKSKETAEIPGTGLGLWIAKELTEKMGGKIYVESILGKGSRFSVVFPLLQK